MGGVYSSSSLKLGLTFEPDVVVDEVLETFDGVRLWVADLWGVREPLLMLLGLS